MSVSTLVAEFEGTDGQHLTVERSLRWPDKEFYLQLLGELDFFPNEDAPAVALAILEAAGYEGKSRTGLAAVSMAVLNLRHYVEEQEAAKREAEGLKALDAEAQQLYEACPTMDNPISWGLLSNKGQEWWRRVAVKAREIHGANNGAGPITEEDLEGIDSSDVLGASK